MLTVARVQAPDDGRATCRSKRRRPPALRPGQRFIFIFARYQSWKWRMPSSIGLW